MQEDWGNLELVKVELVGLARALIKLIKILLTTSASEQVRNKEKMKRKNNKRDGKIGKKIKLESSLGKLAFLISFLILFLYRVITS